MSSAAELGYMLAVKQAAAGGFDVFTKDDMKGMGYSPAEIARETANSARQSSNFAAAQAAGGALTRGNPKLKSVIGGTAQSKGVKAPGGAGSTSSAIKKPSPIANKGWKRTSSTDF